METGKPPSTAELPLELVPQSIHALGGDLEIDGRTSWVSSDARGRQRNSCYLLHGDDETILIDTGPAVLRDVVLTQLRLALPAGVRLSIFLSRAEYETTGNLAAIAAAIPIRRVYTGGSYNPFDGFDLVAGSHVRIASGDSIPLGHGRQLEIITAPLRMLTTYWAYDTESHALFPSDCFGYTIDSPEITLEQAWSNLISRYWWLPGASTTEISGRLAEVFGPRDVNIVAPVHGCILVGRPTVDSHRQLLSRMLANAPTGGSQ